MEYLIFLIILVVKEPLSTLLSKANLVRVLPISVLLSSWTRLARYLTLLLVQVLKVSMNLIGGCTAWFWGDCDKRQLQSDSDE